MIYKSILILLLSLNSIYCQNETDPILVNQKIVTKKPDSVFVRHVLTELNELKHSISELRSSNDEIRNSNNFLMLICLGVLSGIIASIILLVFKNIIDEIGLKKKFKNLEGEYGHFVEREIKKGCKTKIKYYKGGKLLFNTTTEYGNWNARIIMDKDIPQIGGGAFYYEDKEERGFMQISVQDENVIYIFPFTLTHTTQKINFYFLKRITTTKHTYE